MNNDLISRSELKKAFEDYEAYSDIFPKTVYDIIDNAPTVEAFTENDKALAYCEGYVRGSNEAYVRPQGYFDISKLRLMTVEECAGHTIDYAMGWKACIEWIKKGGAK